MEKLGATFDCLFLIHGNRPLKTGLLHHLMKMAGITEADL
jgi:hypothetical protein